MASDPDEFLPAAYPRTWERLPEQARSALRQSHHDPERVPESLRSLAADHGLPEYLPELAELEATVRHCRQYAESTDNHPSGLDLNPSLSMVHLQWGGLLELVDPDPGSGQERDGPGLLQKERTGLIWWDPFRERVRLEAANNWDLLVLKIVAEDLDVRKVAAGHGLRPSRLYGLLHRARAKGLLLGPASRLRRSPEVVPQDGPLAREYDTARIFTLQWHVTDVCDLRCRHCYGGGSPSRHMERETADRVLREMSELCRQKNVRGQITFTGGNPLLHPEFFEMYQAAVDEGFLVAILGNPTDTATLERLLAMDHPAQYQVSLEGLREHNDHIRQAGHYHRVLGFLDRLREYEVPSQVMLTLTRANMDQVLPLAEELRNRADRFTFNRISLVGQGAALQPPEFKAYRRFLRDYLQAARDNPVLRLKDNTLNPILAEQGAEPFGGCTGYGCGAAFNFLALLPDGQVHACRKFPSPLGSIHDQSLTEIFDSSIAAAYRRAPEACLGCSLAPVCRGCPAVVHSFGGDVFQDRDPYCPGPF